MPTIEVVSHCWNYSRLLTFQLSAFALYPPTRNKLTATVFYSLDDADTVRVIQFFDGMPIPNVTWNFRPLETPRLLRRAIGRNSAALQSTADVVMFTDCDYIYREFALDRITEAMIGPESSGDIEPAKRLGFVRRHHASISHESGDAEIESINTTLRTCHAVDVCLDRYETSKLNRPIGGSQIVTGDFARRHGYLPESRRFQRPAGKWERTFDDRAYRGYCHEIGGLQDFPIDCLQVYRIRHSKRGRFDRGVKL